MAVAYEPRRFSVDEYYAMAAAGVFAPGERIELLDGEIVTMAPIGPRHGGDIDRLNRLFSARFGTRAIVRVQGPVRLSRDSEVQPDIALLRLRDDFYGVRPRRRLTSTRLSRSRSRRSPTNAARNARRTPAVASPIIG